MGTLPGRPDDVILFYGQSKALVRMMIDDFGPEKMREFMARYKDGASMDHALEQTYSLDRDGIENRLRRSLGTSLLPSSIQASQRPTPLPAPTVLPYTLQPDQNGRFVGGSDDMRVSQTPANPQSTTDRNGRFVGGSDGMRASQTTANSPALPIQNSTPLRLPNTPVPLVYAAAPTSNSQPSAPADAAESQRSRTSLPTLDPAPADTAESSPSTAPQVTTGCAAPASSAPVDLAAAIAIVGLAVLRAHTLRPRPKSETLPA